MRITRLLLAGVAAIAVSSAASAADLIIEEPEDVFVAEPESDISPYLGIFGGVGFGDANHITNDPGDEPGNDIDLAGPFVGVNAGVDFTLSEAFILGVVGDIAWSGINGSIIDPPFGISDEIEHRIDWFGSLRGRIGFDAGGFMPYLTGGLAVAQGTREGFDAPTGPVSATHVGWTLGAGVAARVTENVSVDVLYRFSDYGAQDYDTGGTPPTVDLEVHTIQAGINFHF